MNRPEITQAERLDSTQASVGFWNTFVFWLKLDVSSFGGNRRVRRTTTSVGGVGAALACGLCCFAMILPSYAVERFKRLSVADVKRLFVGHTFSDEAHWSYHFEADGVVKAVDLGTAKRGVWRFSRGELCLDFTERGKPVSDCYQVWLSANKVRFQRDGVLIIEGMLLDE